MSQWFRSRFDQSGKSLILTGVISSVGWALPLQAQESTAPQVEEVLVIGSYQWKAPGVCCNHHAQRWRDGGPERYSDGHGGST